MTSFNDVDWILAGLRLAPVLTALALAGPASIVAVHLYRRAMSIRPAESVVAGAKWRASRPPLAWR